MKRCPICGIDKDENDFTKNKKRKDGLCCYCRTCDIRKKNISINKKWKEGGIKFCKICKTEKDLHEFYKTSPYCKICHNRIQREKSKVELRRISKEKWETVQPKCIYCKNLIPFKRFFNSNTKSLYCSEKCSSQRGKDYYRRNKKKINEKSKPKKKEYYEKVVKPKKTVYERPCKFCGKIIKTTSTKIRYCSERCRINFYRNKKYKTDPLFKIEASLRSRMRHALKNSKKSKKTMELVGCSLEELKKYLENKFTIGMTWENHSYYGWHIDHILPCASFDLTNEDEQKKCFHYTNLQPLWGSENRKKSDKIL